MNNRVTAVMVQVDGYTRPWVYVWRSTYAGKISRLYKNTTLASLRRCQRAQRWPLERREHDQQAQQAQSIS